MSHELKRVTKLAWRRLLVSDAGTEGMLVLKEQQPSIGGAGESHQIIFQAGVNEGYSQAIAKIYQLASAESEDKNLELSPP